MGLGDWLITEKSFEWILQSFGKGIENVGLLAIAWELQGQHKEHLTIAQGIWDMLKEHM